MTHAEIMAARAGRQLDAAVAEKVMGWDPHQLRGQPNKDLYKDPCWGSYWCPSTDIAAAWEVVEKIRLDHDWALELDSLHTGWRVILYHAGQKPMVTQHAETACLAICRAALLAVAGS